MIERPRESGARCWVCESEARPDPVIGVDGYLRCQRCGLLFQGRRAPGEAEGLYDDAYFECFAGGGGYNEDDAQRAYEAGRRLRFLRRFATSGRLLEVGSAGGHFLDQARRAGFQVWGIEPVGTMAVASASRFNLQVEQGTVEAADLGAGVLEVICASHVLEHLDKPRLALARMRMALVDEGLLVLEVPNIESLLARRRGSRWFNLQPSHHMAHYGPDSLRAALEVSGFSVLCSTTVPALEYIPLRKLVRKESLAGLGALVRASRTFSMREHAHRHEFLRVVAAKDLREGSRASP